MPKTLDERIADIDHRLKRWRPRLTRAHNEVQRLLKQRERLIKVKVTQAVPKAAAAFAEMRKQRVKDANPSLLPHQVEAVANMVESVDQRLGELASPPPQPPLDIPEFMRRGMAAQAAVNKVIEDHKKPMTKRQRDRLAKLDEKRRGRVLDKPLTGKAAMDYIKRRK